MLDLKYLLRAVHPASDRLDTAADSTDAWASSIPLIPDPERDQPSTDSLNDPAVLVCSLPLDRKRPRRNLDFSETVSLCGTMRDGA